MRSDGAWFACWAYGWTGAVLTLIVAFAGCSGDAVSERPSESPVPVNEAPAAPVEAPEPPGVSQQQLVRAILDGATVEDAEAAWMAAVQRVHQLGGSFEFDAAGRLIGVDLASGRVAITGDDLRQLAALKQLVRLKVYSGDVGNTDLAALIGMTQLRELALRNTKIDASGLKQLTALRNLEALDLQRSVNLRDEAFAVLVEFPKLAELALVEGVFTDAALDHFRQLPQLKALDLRSCSGLTATGLARLAQFGQLRSLKIGGASIDDASLPLLAKIATLTSLTIEDASVTGEGLAALVALPLEDLSLARCFGITDEALAVIGRMSGLRQLYVRDILISGSGLGQLAPLARLSTLRLRQTGVGDAALGDLAKLPALRRLELAQSWITDEGLATIGEQTGLNQLDVEDNRLSDEGVKHLGRLVELERLNLAQNESVTDAALDVLQHLPKLRELDLRGTSVSAPALDAFRARHPECRVLQ